MKNYDNTRICITVKRTQEHSHRARMVGPLAVYSGGSVWVQLSRAGIKSLSIGPITICDIDSDARCSPRSRSHIAGIESPFGNLPRTHIFIRKHRVKGPSRKKSHTLSEIYLKPRNPLGNPLKMTMLREYPYTLTNYITGF